MASINPRKNKDGKITSYTIRVYHGYDGSGKRLKPYSMSYKPAPGMTERQIEKELTKQAVQFEERCKTGFSGNGDRIKLNEFVPLYLDAEKGRLSPAAYRSYTKVIESAILPVLGNYRLTELRPVHIQEFVKILTNTPMKTRHGETYADGRTPSAATVKRKLAVLQSILSFAVKLGCITDSPASATRLTLPKTTAPDIEIFTKQEAIYMLTCLEREPLQFRTLIQLAIYTGARQGELVGLKFSDIDFFNGRITINRSAYKLPGEPIKTKPPKSGKTRTISAGTVCMEMLEELFRQHKTEAAELGSQWQEGGWVFTKWNGEIMNPTAPAKMFDKFLKRNNIGHRKFHSLRHTSATLLLYNGTDIKTVQERLGHADLTTTNKYLHLVEQADSEAATAIETLLRPTKSGQA